MEIRRKYDEGEGIQNVAYTYMDSRRKNGVRNVTHEGFFEFRAKCCMKF